MINVFLIRIDREGSKLWFRNSLLHRDYGKPAIIYSDGRKWWCKDGGVIGYEYKGKD